MKTVVLIEDNETIRENTREILDVAGYKVVSAANGQEGLQQINDVLPDIILCDIMMPVIDGFGVLIELNKNIKTAGIPFVFLTARAEILDKRNGLNLGADDYIIKPFDDELLLAVIDTRIKKNEAARERLFQERQAYVKELEHMLHMTSHRVRAPLCTFLGMMQLIDTNAPLDEPEVKKILEFSKNCALELDEFTKDLTIFLERSREKKDKG